MTFKTEEFREYLRIDKLNLDREIIEQPLLFYKVSSAFATAASERDAFKEELATVDAEVDREIRKKLERQNTKGRTTEGHIKSGVQSDPRHQKAFTDWLEAKERADVLNALKDAFQQRSYMLRDLCSLYVANYFEQNSVRGTDASDTLTYQRNRARLKEAREVKKRD